MSLDRPSRFEPFAGLPVASLLRNDGWQIRFLSSPVLQRLEPLHWQQLLQGMKALRLAAGDTLIEFDAPADACFVLQSGRARVHRCGRTLAELEPGALFGEDALITGARRNASVTLLTDGRVGRLSAERFEQWLLAAVIRPLASVGARVPLSIDAGGGPPTGGAGLALGQIRAADAVISRSVRYCVVGGDLRQRWLAAFVLAQQGFDVLPLDDPPDAGRASADR